MIFSGGHHEPHPGDDKFSHIPTLVGATAIQERQAELAGILGEPVGDVVTVTGGGARRDFEHGSMFWSLATGAFEVHGAILERYIQMGADASILGYPTTDESDGADGGRFNRFSHGTLFWHPDPDVGVHLVFGAIHDKWLALGADQGALGRPLSDELVAADGMGRLSNFTHGTIAWHPSIGQAFGMTEKIRDNWRENRGELGFLGYPTSDTTSAADTSTNRFQRGSIFEDNFTEKTWSIADAVEIDTVLVTDESVGGSAVWRMDSSGLWGWTGHLHNSGFIGLNASVGLALKFKDANGNGFGPPIQEGSLGGSADEESRDFDWDIGGFSDDISRHWDDIRDAGIVTRVEVNASAGAITVLIFEAIFCIALIAFAVQPGPVHGKKCPPGALSDSETQVIWKGDGPEPNCPP